MLLRGGLKRGDRLTKMMSQDTVFIQMDRSLASRSSADRIHIHYQWIGVEINKHESNDQHVAIMHTV